MVTPAELSNPDRSDYARILNLIPEGSRVLDLGCGDGSLLYRLKHEKRVQGAGIEIAQERVIQAMEQGVSVCHGNVEICLADYPDKSYDYVVMNQTLQVTNRPLLVLKESLRVGKKVVVVFPNFAHWQVRMNFVLTGRMPRTPLLTFEWYDTPNIHLFSVKDFKSLCEAEKLAILHEEYLAFDRWSDSAGFRSYANAFASMALLMITRR